MGYFEANLIVVERVTERGERFIVARVKHDESQVFHPEEPEKYWETKIFPGWDSAPEAFAWAQKQFMQLSM